MAEPTNSNRLEPFRSELATVLASKYFTRAPKLARLLAYVCEKYFAGEANQIKEYSIAVEVFDRSASFDQDSDSIVRVEANRLRRQLAEYYAQEGAPNRLHIEIPVGQYVPEFVLRAENPVGDESIPTMPPTEDNGKIVRNKKFRLQAVWIAGVCTVLALGFAATLLWLHHDRQPAPASNVQPGEIIEAQIGPPVGEDIRILSGSSRSFVDHSGKMWNADTWFEGGEATKSPVVHIWRTQDPSFYRTNRQGQFRYKIPLKKGLYELHLHFAETDFGPESTATGGEGSRLFTVRANGKTLLERFDIVADAGASRTADVKVFTEISPAADGMLTLEFVGESGSRATLSGIEILPGLRGRMRPVRLLPRQTPYYSNDSHWWSPDNYFEGGQMASYSAPVSGTGDPELYETERWGNFSYAIPVARGKYTVVLHFAARRGREELPPLSTAGSKAPAAHLFDVFCNGNVLLRHFDLEKEARGTDVLERKITGLVPNAQGKLLLNFVPVEGYATISGLEILPE